MFNRGSRKYEITAPTAEMTQKMQFAPPPALLLTEQSHEKRPVSRHKSSQPPTNSKQPVRRHLSDSNLLDEDEEPPSVQKRGKDEKKSKKGNYQFISIFKKRNGNKEKDDEPAFTDNAFGRRSADSQQHMYPPRSPGRYPRMSTSLKRNEEPIATGRRPHSVVTSKANNIHGVPPPSGYIPPPRSVQSRSKTPDEPEQDAYDTLEGAIASSARYKAGNNHDHISRQQSNPDRSPGAPPRNLHRPAPQPPPVPTSSRPTAPKAKGADDRLSNSPPPLPTPTAILSLPTYVPGLIGLKNHGNTCFMNAVIQCLCNTEQLLKYFLTNQYYRNLTQLRNRQQAHPGGILGGDPSSLLPGTQSDTNPESLNPELRGAVTTHLALLLKSLWNGQYEGYVSNAFKDVVGLWAQQYQGRDQHDAQEFLLWLLDRLHEDLNNAPGVKRKQAITNTVNRPDEDLAAETLSDHLLRHDSMVQSLFGAQYHSTLRCPQCNTRSCTFDPYLCISLSVPRRGTRPLYITMARRYQKTTRLMVFGLSVKVSATVRDVQRMLAVEARTLPHYLVLGDMKHDGFHRFFRSNDPIGMISDQGLLYAYEVTPYKGENPIAPYEVPGMPGGNGGGETIFILLQNRVGQGEYSRKFGPPLLLRVWRDSTYSQLQSVVFKAMRQLMFDGVNPEVVCRDYIFFRCQVLDGLEGQEYLDPYNPSPLVSPTVEKALSLGKMWGYEPHIKIIAEWDQWVKDCVCKDMPDPEPPLHSSVELVKDHYSTPVEASLEECLQWHTREEKLDEDESWVCPNCNRPQPGATKSTSFWTLPDVMVLHLKRFEQDEYTQSKLNTFVKFPMESLNMAPYITQKDTPRPLSASGFRKYAQDTKSNSLSSSGALLGGKSTGTDKLNPTRNSTSRSSKFFVRKSKKSKKIEPSSNGRNAPTPAYLLPAPPKGGMTGYEDSDETMYDLFAVCNHHGDMNRGHYISYCKNPVASDWFIYDDQNVLPIQNKDQVISQHAYILFYLRRGAKMKLPGNTLNHTDTRSVVEKHHWLDTIPKYTLDITQLSAYEGMRTSSRRQGSTGSAQPAFSDSGVSPPNANGVFFGPPASTAAYTAASVVSAPPLYRTQLNSTDTDGSSESNLTSVHPTATSHTLPPGSLPPPANYAFQPHHALRIPTGHALPTLQPPTSHTLPPHALPPHTAPTPTSPATVLSQGTNHTHNISHAPNHLRRRAGSFHGTTRFGIGVSKQTADGRIATRL